MDNQTFHSQEAEQGILGLIMCDGDAIDEITKLRDVHFYNPVHADIFKVISTLAMTGNEVTPLTVKMRFEQDSRLEGIGGVEYIARLATYRIARATLSGYEDLIIDLYKRRECSERLLDATASLSDIDKDASVIIEDIISDIDAVSADQGGSTKSESSETLAKQFLQYIDGQDEAAVCKSGYYDLDRLIGGFAPGRVYVLAGRPSMGKSAAALNIVRNVGSNGGGVVFLSLEMTNAGQSERMVASIGAGTFGPASFPPYSELRSQWRKGNRSMIETACEEMGRMNVEWEEGVGLSLNNIRMVTNRAIRSLRGRGATLDLLVIDHIGHVQGSRKGQSNYEKVTEVSNALIAIAKNYDVPVLALCQLSRAIEQRDDKRPQLSDLRESGHIEQDASVVIGMYRDYYYAEREARAAKGDDQELQSRLLDGQNKLEFLVLKNRHGNIGKVDLYCELSRMFIDNRGNDYRGVAA